MAEITVAIIGGPKSGKSSLQARIVDKKFPTGPMPFAEFRRTTVQLPGHIEIQVNVGDRPSQERFGTATAQFFQQANAFLVLQSVAVEPTVDAEDEEPTDEVINWLQEINRYAFDKTPTIIVGTKTDRSDRRISAEQMMACAKEHDVLYREVSALTGANVQQVLQEAVRLALDKPRRQRARTLTANDAQPASPAAQPKCCQG